MFFSQRIGVFVAILVSILAVGFIVLSNLFQNVNEWFILIFFALIIFIVVYVVVFYTIHNYIIKKITPIYKTIQSFNYSKGTLFEELESKDIVLKVNKDVIHWAKDKTNEIKQLKELEKFRKEFLGDVSHELKTPIFNIQGYVLTLLDGAIDDPDINKRYLERAEKSINRIISIVNDLESISRLESGELKLNFEKFNVINLVEEIYEVNEMNARKRNISLKMKLNQNKKLIVYADKARYAQIFVNLIDNSIKYGNNDGTTTIEFFDMDDNVLVEISDNGLGISEEHISRIFDRFYRVDKSRSREQGGTGLGLSIVKHIVEAHGQNINVRSELNKGTSFAFTISKAKRPS